MLTGRLRLAQAWQLVFISALVLVASGAAAHLGLRRSTPSDGAHLAEAAREIRLTFTEAVDLSQARVQLLGPSDVGVPLSRLTHPGDSAQVIAATVEGALEAGPYRIQWQVVGRDGHPVRGTITYVIAPGATGLVDPVRPAGDPGAASSDSTPAARETPRHDPRSMPSGEDFDAESPGYVVIRSLQFTSLLTVIGSLTFGIVVLGVFGRTTPTVLAAGTSRAPTPNDPGEAGIGNGEPGSAMIREMRARAARLGVLAGAALLLTAFARLYAQSLAMHGTSDALNTELVTTMVTRTGWGSGWMLEVGAAITAIAGFLLARRNRPGGWAIAAGAGIGLAITPGLSGHAAATPDLALPAMLADALHIIGAAGWLGSLLFVLAVGIPVAMRLDADRRGAAVARLINAFSPTALVFATILILTGLFAAWLHVGISSALWTSDYGRTLLWKLGVLVAVISLGAWNWLRVKPTLGTDAAAHRLKRSATTELALAAVIIIITATLVATPPPGDATETVAGQSETRAER